MKYKEHYKTDYFKWQGAIGEFGGWANMDKFKDYIYSNHTVIDFGCGGGFLLNNINCKEKIGIEINETARNNAKKLGVVTVEKSREIKNNFADVIISNNALEHTTHPLNELKDLFCILKQGGKIIFIVPCESIKYKYEHNDINYHLYSWSPMAIGNLFTEAGFKVIESKSYIHKWPPYYNKIAKIFNRKIFNLICHVYARFENSWHQVRIIAEKPMTK